MPQALVPIDTPLSIICKHIPRQSDIDKIVKNIETCVIHSLELLIQSQDLIKANQNTQMPQALVPIDTPLSIICKHIPRQSDIDKIVKNIETCVIHSLELLIQSQDLIKANQNSTCFRDIYQYILMENFHPVQKHKIVLEPKHLIMWSSITFCSG